MKGSESAKTSINHIASGLKKLKYGINLDWGGGKYDSGTNYLKNKGIINLIYDPYNRSEKHNLSVLNQLKNGADTGTLLNVLNVIPTKKERLETIAKMIPYIKKNGKILISIYNRNNSKKSIKTCRGWQNNQPLEFYQKELESEGYKLKKEGKYLIIFKHI